MKGERHWNVLIKSEAEAAQVTPDRPQQAVLQLLRPRVSSFGISPKHQRSQTQGQVWQGHKAPEHPCHGDTHSHSESTGAHGEREGWCHHCVACRSCRDAEPCPGLPAPSSNGTPCTPARETPLFLLATPHGLYLRCGLQNLHSTRVPEQRSPKTAPQGGKHQPARVPGRCSTAASSDKDSN